MKICSEATKLHDVDGRTSAKGCVFELPKGAAAPTYQTILVGKDLFQIVTWLEPTDEERRDAEVAAARGAGRGGIVVPQR